MIGLQCVLVAWALPALAADAPAPPSGPLVGKAQALTRALAEKDFDRVKKEFDEAMTKALPGDKLEEIWKSVAGKLGDFKDSTAVRTSKVKGFDVVLLACRFDKGELDARLVFDAKGRLSGLQFPPRGKVPPYARPETFTESAVTINPGEWELPGALALPKGEGPFPVVVLLAGSGPNDRDETIGPNKPLRDLAWGLASRGIATLRYDKRTRAHGARMPLETITLKEEVIDDALAAIKLLRAHKSIDAGKVFVLGHSLGAIAAPRIAALEPKLAGAILLAGTTRPLEDVILDQVTYISSLKGPLAFFDKGELEKLKKQVARAKDKDLSPKTPASELPLGMVPGSYWLALRDYDHVGTARALTQPVLVLQGERDYQSTMTDFEGWKKALADKANATLKSYPKLNHLFMEGKGKSTPSEYEKGDNVSAEVIDDLVAWVKGR